MKSFDNRLQNDLFPKKPAAFDRMVKDQLMNVCGRSEAKQDVMRFTETDSDTQPQRKKSRAFGRVWTVAVAAVLVVSLLAVGTVFALARRTKSSSAAQVAESPAATAEQDTSNTVFAATVDEFLAAIASDTTIILTGEVYNLSTADTYGTDGGNKHMWREVEDGYELVLCNLENLRIVGSENTVIETDPRHAEVLEAEHCTGLSLQNLTIGHTKKPEKCSGAVICLTDCTDTRVEACRLYGCGSWGVTAWYGKNLTVTDSEIYECSSGALHIWECAGTEVNESTIRNCGGGGTLADLIYIQDSDVSVLNCNIYENTTESSLIYVGDDGTAAHRISLIGTSLHDNRLAHRSNYVINYTNPDPDKGTRMTVDGCAFKDNGDNPILPESSRVFDRSGNTLGDAELAAMTLQRGGTASTEQPGGTDACGTFAAQLPTPSATPAPAAQKTVHVSNTEELLAAIAPNTEIVLAAGVYDLGMDAEPFTEENPYCSFVTRYRTDGDRFFKITGVDGLSIRAEDGAECVLTASHKNACEAVFAVESCSGFVLSGITVSGDAENDLLLLRCSDVRMEGCTLAAGSDDPVSGTPSGIGLFDCSGITVSDSRIEGCASAVYAMDSKSVTVSACELVNCFGATWMSNTDDILFTSCSIHDCRNEDPAQGEEQGDASYLIQIDGQSSTVLTATFEDCEITNNKCTFFFSADGIDEVTLSGLKIHDNGFGRLFEFEATSDLAGRYVIKNCDVDRNRIGTFLFCGQPDAKTVLSGTSIADNEMDTVFFGGDVTVSGCAFLSPEITRWIGSHESYPDLKTYIHDADGNALSEAELWAMELKRDNP